MSSAFTDPQWIRVDLGTSTSIKRVMLTWEAAYAKSFQIQTSPDGNTWTTIYSTTTGTGGINDLAVTGTGRFVRMNGTVRAMAYGYSLWEFEVYGPGSSFVLSSRVRCRLTRSAAQACASAPSSSAEAGDDHPLAARRQGCDRQTG